jgi:hypothetical protein
VGSGFEFRRMLSKFADDDREKKVVKISDVAGKTELFATINNYLLTINSIIL